tara:strand:- start:4756 stop:6549 length:1794 start_codon:yes stop_codon:yes gene_type:complete
MASKLSKLIDRHLDYYKRAEKKDFDKARRFYRGNFFASSDSDIQGLSQSSYLCSKNLIYAIADTAVSALLGPNPSVGAVARTPVSQDAAPAVTGLIEYVFESNRFRRKAATALIDAVLCKRGIFKTGWDSKRDIPIVRAINPSSVFFDLTVRDPDDIRYWIEATVISFEEFKQRVKSGQYNAELVKEIRPDRYPKWLLDDNQKNQTNHVRDAFQWVTVYEYYDRERGMIQHYIKQADAVVFEDKIDYIPYSMFTLNQSGIDCTGLSEVQLVLKQQETINDLLTHMKQITYLQIPRVMYDSGRITEEDLNKAVESSAGSFVGINPSNGDALRSLATLFYEMPIPDSPAGVKEFIARQEDDAAFISALAEAARGQVAGARTATEMAIIDAQLRTRLATREGHLNDALEDVAKKVFYLCKKYMREKRLIRISGSNKWEELNHQNLIEIDVDFEMVGHNPIRRNPGMMAETLIQLLPFLSQNQNVDVRRLTEEILTNLGLPARIMIPEAEIIAQQEAMAAQQQALIQAEQQANLGGAAAGKPAIEAQEKAQLQQLLASLPPDEAEEMIMAIAQQQAGGEVPVDDTGEALPGGGGAPIRGEA